MTLLTATIKHTFTPLFHGKRYYYVVDYIATDNDIYYFDVNTGEFDKKIDGEFQRLFVVPKKLIKRFLKELQLKNYNNNKLRIW